MTLGVKPETLLAVCGLLQVFAGVALIILIPELGPIAIGALTIVLGAAVFVLANHIEQTEFDRINRRVNSRDN